MTIRRAIGQPNLSADDLTFSHGDRHFGIEITDMGAGARMCSLFERMNGVWSVPDFGLAGEQTIHIHWGSNEAIEAAGGARVWIRDQFVPWLNNLLSAIFPATTGPQPVGTAIEQVDALLKGSVSFAYGADGTIRAVYTGG